MTLSTKQRSEQLKELLNAVERGNKRDAFDYTAGYLNEANLFKAKEFHSHKGWDGVISHLPKPNKGIDTRKVDIKDSGMSEVLSQFVLGTDGFLPQVKRDKLQGNKQRHSEISKSVDEQALIEEIDSRRFMLNRSQPIRSHKTWAEEDDRDDSEAVRKSNSVPPKHTFYNVNTGATKKDKLRNLRSFEKEAIQKDEILKRNVLYNNSEILKVEERLNKTLMMLGYGPGTAYHRLQAHGEALESVVDISPIFFEDLRQIKAEYDDYVGWLLDTQPTQSHILKEQVEDLYDKKVSNPKQLGAVKEQTHRLEREGKRLLELNDKLREDLRRVKEENTRKFAANDLYTQRLTVSKDEKPNLADQLEDLHATIMEKLEKLDEMKAKIREELVPISVCQNLEQCLKDSEIEVQKLLKQNEIVNKEVSEMEEGIAKALDDCDIPESDKRRCSVKVSKTYIPGIRQSFDTYESFSKYILETAEDFIPNATSKKGDEQETDEEDEYLSDKWNWYIS